MLPIVYITARLVWTAASYLFRRLRCPLGDHVRSAADLGLPFTCVSLYYRYNGQQRFDDHGHQSMHDHRARDLLEPAGSVAIDTVDGPVQVKLWRREVKGSAAASTCCFSTPTSRGTPSIRGS